jgi:hypothetical protein
MNCGRRRAQRITGHKTLDPGRKPGGTEKEGSVERGVRGTGPGPSCVPPNSGAPDLRLNAEKPA